LTGLSIDIEPRTLLPKALFSATFCIVGVEYIADETPYPGVAVMRKIWSAMLVFLLSPALYANPSIPELIDRFKSTKDMRPLIQQLHKNNISAATFVRLAAEHKVQKALNTFKVYHWEDRQEIQRIEQTIQSKPQNVGTMRYRCHKSLKEDKPKLQQIIESQAYCWPQNVTVHYGLEDEPTTVAFRQADGSYRFRLCLPASFLEKSSEEQNALLGHEHAHLVRHHNERLYELGPFPLKLFCNERGTSSEEALSLFQTGQWSIQEAKTSKTLERVCRAQEYEADWLALLRENPRSILTGMHRLLKQEKSNFEHPSKEKRLEWAQKFVTLLEAEQELHHKASHA